MESLDTKQLDLCRGCKKPFSQLTELIPLTPQEETTLLQKLDQHQDRLPIALKRLRRKLIVRQNNRRRGMALFDLDAKVLPTLNPSYSHQPAEGNHRVMIKKRDKVLREFMAFCKRPVPFDKSLHRKLFGDPFLKFVSTSKKPFSSPFTGRHLKPFIRRDYESTPLMMSLLQEIHERYPQEDIDFKLSPMDYVHFQECHLEQVNEILHKMFWPGIDVKEHLLFPDFGIIAMYQKRVIGCGLMTPEGYISYITVLPSWSNAGIARFMLYYLIKVSGSKDVTLHVSATNPAMILYQKFGFKPEQYIVDFYDKYYPPNTWHCKNAYFVRLRK